MIKLNLPDSNYVKKEIAEKGFVVLKKVVPEKFIQLQKERWCSNFSIKKVDKKFVRGKLCLGEKNFLSYSDIPAWCLYRNYEFLWNSNLDNNATFVHLSLHKFRNKIQDLDLNDGLNYNQKNFGIYISTSLYETNKGHLLTHSDGHADKPIIHYMLPYTFRKIDYEAGGLICEDNNGNMQDMEANIVPGDVIMFDGRKKHGVVKIESSKKNHVGRLAAFSIPTFFIREYGLKSSIRSFEIFIKELANKLKGLGKFLPKKI